MRCLVTGASGFLGSHLTRELLARNHEVVVLLRPGSNTDRLDDCLERVCVIQGSVDELSEVERYLRATPVEAALHLAWSGITADVRNRTDLATFNVIHTLKLWNLLLATGCHIFLGLGSQAEYGLCSGIVHEDSQTVPLTAYGSAKLALGSFLQQLCAIERMRFVWLRLFSAFGPGDNERNMVPFLIRALLARERPRLTAGEQIWDYLYVEDAARAICATLEVGASGIFNLGSGVPCLLRDFVCRVRDSIDPGLPLGFGEIPYREGQVMYLLSSITRLSEVTGWKPKVTLGEGIRRTVEWYARKHREVPRSIRLAEVRSSAPLGWR